MNAVYDQIVDALGLDEATAEGEDIRFKVIKGAEGKILAHAVNQKNLVFKNGMLIDYVAISNKIYLYNNPNHDNYTAYDNGEINVIFTIDVEAYKDFQEINEIIDSIYEESDTHRSTRLLVEKIWRRQSANKNDMHDAISERGSNGGNDTLYEIRAVTDADNTNGSKIRRKDSSKSQSNKELDDDIDFRISAEQDAEYLAAVERGDMEIAKRMVDEDGNPKVVYHQINAKVYVNSETGQNWDDLNWKEKMEWYWITTTKEGTREFCL